MKQILFSIIWISFLTLGLLSLGSVPLYAATPCDEIPTPSASATPIINYDKNKPTEYALLAPLPNIDPNSNCNEISNVTLVTYLNTVFRISIALAGVFAVFMIVLGGFQYLTTDAIGGKEEGKERIWNALQGLIMVLSSYFILSIINPRYVTLDPNVIKPLTNLQQLKSDAAVDFIDSQMQLTAEAKKNIAIAQAKAVQLRALSDSQYENGDFEEAAKNRAAAVEQEKIAATILGDETIAWNKNFAQNVLEDQVSDQSIQDVENAKQRILTTTGSVAKKLEDIGDLEGAAKMKGQGIYQAATLDMDSMIAQAKSTYTAGAGTETSQVAEDQLQDEINKIEENRINTSKTITDPTLKQKYISESRAKIDTLKKLLKGTQ